MQSQDTMSRAKLSRALFPVLLPMTLRYCFQYTTDTQVEEKVEELRELLPGEHVARVVSTAPDLLLNDMQTCLRPRMTRLVAALTTVKHFQGVIDADKVI